VYAANVAELINGHDLDHRLFRLMEPISDFNYERGIWAFVVGTEARNYARSGGSKLTA
jgi:hypothetical protein